MPLRVSWSYDESDKSRIKMSHKGHYAKVRKPTGPELYEDASRILDELLKKQISAGLKLHGGRRHPRFKTYPSHNKSVATPDVLDEIDEEDDNGIERSKTMPSQRRGSSSKESHPSKETKFRRKDSFSSASSADTEGDSEIISASRKKKSLLKKVKEKFLRTVNREDREKQMRVNNKQDAGGSPKTKAANKGKSDRNGHKDLMKRGDKRRGDADSKDSSQSSQIDDASAIRKNSVGMTFIKSIRRSFSSKRGRREYMQAGSTEFSDQGKAKRPPEDTTGSSKSQTPSPVKDSSLPLTPQVPPPPLPPPPPPPPPQTFSVGATLPIPSHEKSPSPFPKSSSTDSHHSSGDKSSSLLSTISSHRNYRLRTGVSGDDYRNIKFMDDSDDDDDVDDWDEDHVVERQMGGQGDVLPAGTASYRSEQDGRMLLNQQSSLCVDGDTEDDMHDGKGNLPLHERSEEEKGEMFGKIAQKLIDMGETYAAESGLSDSEHHPREAHAQSGAETGLMSDLEKQLIECLREIGDRNSKVLDQYAQEAMEVTKAQAYDRFKQTMQHSLGEEISWNHLALLFYTSKGVITAVGKGTVLAKDVKEMTLHYFSEKFAKWIMDQGGFDGILSDSDSELD